MNEVFVVAAQRTPIGSFLGNLADRSAPELGAHAIGAAFGKSAFEGDKNADFYRVILRQRR